VEEDQQGVTVASCKQQPTARAKVGNGRPVRHDRAMTGIR
jgi:hypothetical protein